MKSPQVGDWGTPFTLTLYKTSSSKLNLSSASPINIIFTKPDGTQFSREASLVTDGTDGQMTYTIQAGELDVAGDWKWQGQATYVNGSWRSDVLSFVVEANS